MILAEKKLRSIVRKTLLEEKTHTVKANDNPSKIASTYGIAVSRLLDWNKDLDPSRMQIGDTIIIPPPVKKLNSHLSDSDALKAWMMYEEGKMDKLGIGTGKPYLSSYNDGTGRWTIGYGHNQKHQYKQKLDSEKKAVEWLDKDLAAAAKPLQTSTEIDLPTTLAIPVVLSQSEFDALTSLIFNAGEDGYRRSRLHQDFISKGITSGKEFDDAFLSARTSSDLPGIDLRRQRELAMFKGDYRNK